MKTIDMEKWCQLCDALGVPPDNDIDDIIKLVKLKNGLLKKYSKRLHSFKTDKTDEFYKNVSDELGL